MHKVTTCDKHHFFEQTLPIACVRGHFFEKSLAIACERDHFLWKTQVIACDRPHFFEKTRVVACDKAHFVGKTRSITDTAKSGGRLFYRDLRIAAQTIIPFQKTYWLRLRCSPIFNPGRNSSECYSESYAPG